MHALAGVCIALSGDGAFSSWVVGPSDWLGLHKFVSAIPLSLTLLLVAFITVIAVDGPYSRSSEAVSGFKKGKEPATEAVRRS
jgi:hypothetical protein